MKTDTRSLRRVFSNNWFILRVALKEAPLYTFATIIDNAIHEVVVFLEHIYMIAFIVDSIQFQRPFTDVLIFVVSVFSLVALIFVWRYTIKSFVKSKSQEKIYLAIRMMLYKKACAIDLSCYDDPAFYNDLVWSMSEAVGRVEKVLETAKKLIGGIAGILVIGAFVLFSSPIGVVLAVIAVGIAVVADLRANKRQFEMEREMKPLERKRDYINRVFYLGEYAKEIRMSGITPKFYADFKESIGKLEECATKSSFRIVVYRFLKDYVSGTLIFDGLYLVYLLYNAIVRKLFGFGTLYALYNSSQRLKENMKKLSMVIQELTQHSLYIEKIRQFLDHEEKIVDRDDARDVPRTPCTLEIRDVSFAYTDGGGKILDGIRMTILPGQKISLVGYNGAGKTTLVKLLLRLYDPTEGEILYDGINIKEYKIREYREMFGTIFQDYQIFCATLEQNIAMDSARIDRARAKRAITQSEFDDTFGRLEHGLDTQLTREFDENGVNLSGGEAQKVSLGRIFYRDSPIFILDEPSSALDPISEYNVNNTIMKTSTDKTVIFISHRLSTTRMADTIIMLENGAIIEQGTHDALMTRNGKYARMFNLQAAKYR
jgi:ATP-binding cassette, subfamily B, bacterial